jgi:hypothetical protein
MYERSIKNLWNLSRFFPEIKNKISIFAEYFVFMTTIIKINYMCMVGECSFLQTAADQYLSFHCVRKPRWTIGDILLGTS